MRLLVYGHHSHTGFGIVTEQLCARFVAAGVDVRVIAVNHRGEPVRGDMAGRVWPASLYGQPFGGNWSSAAITGAAWRKLDPSDDWKPDMVLVISDVSGMIGHLPPHGFDDAWKSLPVFHYCPIEGDNLSVGWRTLWGLCHPVAMSDYGQRVISEHIGRAVPRIYHGVDTDTFRPVSFAEPLVINDKRLRSRDDCKRQFGIDPERLVILRTDRNVVRKFYPALFTSFVEIARQVPNVDLVLHCQPFDNEGTNLVEDLARMPEDVRGRVKFTEAHDTFKGLSAEALVALVNAADLTVSTTGGEGFGLTLAESLACEVPVVVTDWAADAEVAGPGGVLVPPLIDRYGDVVRYHSQFGMDWATPDPRGFVAPVVDLLTHRKRREALGRAGRLHVKRSFSWDEAARQFLTLFEESDAARLAA